MSVSFYLCLDNQRDGEEIFYIDPARKSVNSLKVTNVYKKACSDCHGQVDFKISVVSDLGTSQSARKRKRERVYDNNAAFYF